MLRTYCVNFFALFIISIICRIGFSLFSPQMFESLTIQEIIEAYVFGLKFDIASAAIPAAIISVLHLLLGRLSFINQFLKSALFLSGVWIILVTAGDMIYFKESARHVTFELFTSEGLESSLLFVVFRSHLSFVLLSLALCYCWWLIYFKTVRVNSFIKVHPNAPLKFDFVFFFLLIPVSAASIRGGWADSPQTPLFAYSIGNLYQADIAWNSHYGVMYYLVKGSQKIIKQAPLPTVEHPEVITKKLYSQYQLPTGTIDLSQLKQAHVVILLLESWAAVDSKSYGGTVDAMPFFDQLRQESLTSDITLANGHRTVEGVFSVFCSYPNPVGGAVVSNQLQTQKYQCLPDVLSQKGWNTWFIQGMSQGRAGNLAQTLGFQQSFGKYDIPDGERNSWGYYDSHIYDFAYQKLRQTEKPVLVAINTMTTHDTTLPKEESYQFDCKDQTSCRQSVTYSSDKDLKKFIQQLKTIKDRPILVVAVADHTANVVEGGLAQYSIPFLVWATDQSVPTKKIVGVTSQRDIAPTVMDWLGGYIPWFTGHSLLSNSNSFADYSHGSTVVWAKGQDVVEINLLQPEYQRCGHIVSAPDNVSYTSCTSTIFSTLQKQAKAYIRYTQQLLFEGATEQFLREY